MDQFDHVVVGAGSVGCVIAARLSEDPRASWSVRWPRMKDIASILLDPPRLTRFDQRCDKEALPGFEVHDASELRDYPRRDTDPCQHAAGTCRMGTDLAAVVDPQLRVHGLDGLRIADASVMPALPGANTDAAVHAIAERAAGLLRGRA
ncbi:GMC oxidoreductase [Streptomyces sp. NPDC001156]